MKRYALIIIALLILSTHALALQCFPGAEGYGTSTVGGRYGTPTIYKVTNLNNSGTGSFRAACEASGARIVVFAVSGHIHLTDILQITNPYILGSSGSSGACSTPSDGNKFNEGFEGTGYENAAFWSVGAGTPNEDASLPGVDPGSLCLQALLADGGSANSYIYHDFGSDAVNTIYVRAYIYIDTAPSTIFDNVELISVGADRDSIGAVLDLRASGGQCTLHVENGVGGSTTTINIDQDTWYRVEIAINRNAESTFYVNGNSIGTFTAGNFNLRWYAAGIIRYGASYDVDAYIDGFSADTTGLLGAP